MTKVCIVDFGAGNMFSIKKALERLGAQASVSSAGDCIEQADAVILPGDGNFGGAAIALAPVKNKLLEAAQEKPFLGICAGMQLLFEKSAESPGTAGLGLFTGALARFSGRVKCPHMGWNRLVEPAGELFDGFSGGEYAYFIHSFRAGESEFASAYCDYGGSFVAALEKGNVFATQFHPEKSGTAGRTVLENFLKICRK